MAEQRVGSRTRRMGSSRRRQLRRDEEQSCTAAVMQRVRDIIQEQCGDPEGFITRADMQKLQEEVVPCSTEELEMLFDGMDAAGTGQLSAEEFTSGLWQLLSSQQPSREHRRRKAASRRSGLVLSSPTWEGMGSEERKHFATFMEQLGVDDRWEEQEIWQLWAKLRKDEPQLLGNLEAFLAKMRQRIQEARSKKEALEETLNRRVAEHNQEVQQLCEALEQQIQEERQRLEQESTARSRLHCAVLQRALDARDRELQRLAAAQEELEAQCCSLRSTQRTASAENQQLEESNRALEEQLQHIHEQLQQTHECLRAATARQRAGEPRDGEEAELPGETLPSVQTNPEQHSLEMRVRLGSQGSEPKHRNIHHVVWEKPPADTKTSQLLSVEEDPFPEFLKEERFSGQGSLLREMSDAIAALSTQKLQAPGDAAPHPQDDAEPQTGPRGSAPRETLSSHEVLEEDPREGRAAAELGAGDGTQDGASAAVHRRAQEQGDSVERAGQRLERVQGVLSVQGKGAGGEQQVLEEVESPWEALGESVGVGEQEWVEGAGWEQGKMEWEKVQLPGEGGCLEAALEALEVELPVGCAATDVHRVLGEHVEEPEVPGWAEEQMAAVQGVKEAPGPDKMDGEGNGGENKGTELQPLSVAGEPGTERAESVGADVQLLEEEDGAKPELQERAGAAAVLGEGPSPAGIPARSPALDELVLVSAQELEGKEAESLVQVEELTLSHGERADGKPLRAAGLWEGAESPAVALEAAPRMADNTDVWDGDAEAALHPENAAAEHGHPGAVLGADEQILEESADTEGRPLDGARGLEAVQGVRLEAEARILAEAQNLELKQGCAASPASEVPLQISVLKLDAMKQEDVLVPDVHRLGGSGQAAQRQLQEQVSAQADEGRLHAAPRQPQKPPGMMEAEQEAAGPAEAPKQGIPQGEDAGKDLWQMAHGDSPLVVSSRVQPHRQLAGEQREDVGVEKEQEKERKMSLGGEPSPGEQEALTGNAAGAVTKGTAEPDHLYNVLFVGDSHVGKTSFLYRLHADSFNPHLAATVGLDYQVKNLTVDNKRFALRLWDSAGQERYHSVTKQFFRKADGVVLMYDITSQYSFADVHYWLSCIQEGAEDGITVLLLGNKADCAAERQVPTQEGQRLAQEHQLLFYECSAASGHNVTESIVSLVRALKVCEDRLRNKAEEVPELPQKKKGCCW